MTAKVHTLFEAQSNSPYIQSLQFSRNLLTPEALPTIYRLDEMRKSAGDVWRGTEIANGHVRMWGLRWSATLSFKANP